MKRWIRAAARRDVVRRSIRVALLVGAILVAVNYTDRWLEGSLVSFDFVKMALTFLVPYCVCTYACVHDSLGQTVLTPNLKWPRGGGNFPERDDAYGLVSSRIRLEVSQRPPPRSWICA